MRDQRRHCYGAAAPPPALDQPRDGDGWHDMRHIVICFFLILYIVIVYSVLFPNHMCEHSNERSTTPLLHDSAPVFSLV